MFEWRGQRVETFGDLGAMVVRICRDGDREEAAEFMAAYREVTAHADINVGYLAGYYDSETAQQIWDWFGVSHPIFGTERPSTEAAYEAGKRAALGEFPGVFDP